MNSSKDFGDLVVALIAHVFTLIFWLLLFLGIGTSIRAPESPWLYWPLYWLFSAAPFVLWGACGVLLVVWWRQGRGPVWKYPLIWALALSGTFFTLFALCFPSFRSRLRPPHFRPDC